MFELECARNPTKSPTIRHATSTPALASRHVKAVAEYRPIQLSRSAFLGFAGRSAATSPVPSSSAMARTKNSAHIPHGTPMYFTTRPLSHPTCLPQRSTGPRCFRLPVFNRSLTWETLRDPNGFKTVQLLFPFAPYAYSGRVVLIAHGPHVPMRTKRKDLTWENSCAHPWCCSRLPQL